jgi:putative Holliday junction resolvase
MRVLAVDYGLRRIGIAVSDPSGTLARPVETIAGSPAPAVAARAILDAIARLEKDDDPIATIVVGLPRRLDGRANDQTPLAEALAAALARCGDRTVVLQDERLTSREAEQVLAVQERDWKVRKRRLDAVAAAVILQEFLDAQKKIEDRRQTTE